MPKIKEPIFAVEISNCKDCFNLKKRFVKETDEVKSFCCHGLTKRPVIIDEHDYRLFKKNGHKKIPIPTFCPLTKD
jgi:hypothetical protein